MYRITNSGEYSLKIILTGNTDQESFNSEYTSFKVGSEESGYNLAELSGNSGTAGDILGLFSSTSLVHSVFKTHEMNRNEYEGDRNTGWWYPEVQHKRRKNSSSKQSGYLHFTEHNRRRTNQNCYTHLNADNPWFCNLDGQTQYVRTVRMYIKTTI